MTPLKAPDYDRADNPTGVALAVESMRRHTTDEGWQLMAGLQHAGYNLAGFGLPTFEGDGWTIPGISRWRRDLTDVREILKWAAPGVVVVQDRREWEGKTAGGPRTFDPRERFTNAGILGDRPDVFKLTVIKDAQSDHELHLATAAEIGAHAWVCYYDEDKVCELAPFVRRRHLVRTWHSVDPAAVPPFAGRRDLGCLLSGATSRAYPLRERLLKNAGRLPWTSVLRHPGYRRDGCHTPAFLQELGRHRVAICTCSIYGYALRKIVEATACGCVVVTNLPRHLEMPEIDDNLVRVPDDIDIDQMGDVIAALVKTWDAERQRELAARAIAWYDYRQVGLRLARDIEAMRRSYQP